MMAVRALRLAAEISQSGGFWAVRLDSDRQKCTVFPGRQPTRGVAHRPGSAGFMLLT